MDDEPAVEAPDLPPVDEEIDRELMGQEEVEPPVPRRRSLRRIRLCRFCTPILTVSETAILPVSFPLPTTAQNSLSALFYPLILDHGVCLIISVPGAKILISFFLLDIFYHCLQSVIIWSSFLLMNLHKEQFQYGLEFLRLSYS